MAPSSDDKVGKLLWPGELRRRLGARYIQVPQVARDAETTETQAAITLQMLAEMGNLQPWVAPKCPDCDNIWPSFLGEDDIPPRIRCPKCEGTANRDDFEFFLVYEVLQEPEE